MPIMFNSILAEEGLDLRDVILIRHQDQKSNRSPFELWRDNRSGFELYQSHQGFKRRRSFQRAKQWASFVAAPGAKTMFVGLYQAKYHGILDHDSPLPHRNEVERAGNCDVYDLALDPRFSDFDGKLFVDWGEGARAWVQRADRQDKRVTELRLKFEEDPFPGFMNFIQPLSTIEALPQNWSAVLKSSAGVYLLTCPKTKEQYVGSVTGREGFWQRWQDYCRNGHGGNVALKSRDPSDYQITILEVAGSFATDHEILEMESRWKQKLQSKEMGLNRN